jgi:monovalent cation:H+ antiporter-2, CPA2 family
VPYGTTLIATICVSLAVAFVAGLLAVRLRLPPLIGYLLAGIVVGPFTPGFVADPHLAAELADIGVMLLMFGVGMHFSLSDLLAVRTIALSGAATQMATATALALAVTRLWGWPLGAGLVFGLALSVASTVVLLRVLEAQDALDSADGHVAVGWLIVQDLVMVLTLVLLPALAGVLGEAAPGSNPDAASNGVLWTLGLTLAKVAAFMVLMWLVGARLLQWVLDAVVQTGSRELFTVAVVAVALGVAYGAAGLFDVSLALGAFFAGMVINESDHSHRAAAESQPIQDAFAVLFFVSVGMLLNPQILVRHPLQVLTVLAIIYLGNSLSAWLIVKAFRYPYGQNIRN